ncbi:MAG: sensor histidine kinase [Flavobacteriales bacterium]
MKLLTRTSLYFLILSVVLFVLGGVIFFFLLRQDLDEDFTENLYIEKEYVEQFAKDSLRLPSAELQTSISLNFEKCNAAFDDVLRDTSLMKPWEEELQPFRQLVFSLNQNDTVYRVTLECPMYESDDLIERIGWSMALIAVVLLIVLFFLTRWLSKRMWQPFFNTLQTLRTFEVIDNKVPVFKEEKTFEFQVLNKELQSLTNRIQSDYRSLKQFTENASHEIQTPLAIIRAKLELLMQTNNLNNEQMQLVKETFETTNRLSKLNQSLLLLSKIENGQYQDSTILDLELLINQKLEQFAELIAHRNLHVGKKFGENSVFSMNSQLADILLSNLLSNAIRHNVEGGDICIDVDSRWFMISNSGVEPNFEPEKMFERFQKQHTSHESVGLGLSIVKQICDTSGFRVMYIFDKGYHRLRIEF